MKFKIAEKVLTTYTGCAGYSTTNETYIIYKNPSVSDLQAKDETKDNRGIIDSKGNLFVEAMWIKEGGNPETDFSNMLHGSLLRVLHKNGECLDLIDGDLRGIHNSSGLKNGLFVIKNFGNSKKFYIAEYDEDVLNNPKSKKLIRKHFDKCKKKNPHFVFLVT
jgi:hypothetical protein